MLEIRTAIAKISCSNPSESGDTVEIIERPGGGFSFVMVDGQGTGRGAKNLSHLVITRALALLADGRTDEAVAQAVHDYLYSYRMGQSYATLNILSVDFKARSIRVTRNNPAPFVVLTPTGVQSYNQASTPIGVHAASLPVVSTIDARPYTYVVLFTDGLLKAGEAYTEDLELANYLAGFVPESGHDPQTLTDALLGRALRLDRGQPADDMSVVTLAVLPAEIGSSNNQFDYPVRRLNSTFPLEQT